ncbi:ATP-binding protein [Streptomyces fodineus]|uniref:ATP-binding protein n=1 Tax=Streptomyces fodineus TaxID=1904616 RepID=UPI001D03CD0A|nr:ATP-binding protein [Streptomyces fodineus]
MRGTTRATSGKLEMDYDVTPLSVRIARTVVSAHLRLWGLENLIDTGALAISELMTNVLDHTRPDSEGRRSARVTVTRIPDGVALCVHDSDSALPLQRRAGDDDENGRGLQLVRAIADKFGISQPPSGGKDVWLTLLVPLDVPTA